MTDDDTRLAPREQSVIDYGQPRPEAQIHAVAHAVEDPLFYQARVLAKSALVPSGLQGKPADIYLIISMGHELGISPVRALSSIHVIKGKPMLSADLMVGIIRSSGVCDYFRMIESTDERATFETQRKGEASPVSLTFTIEQAKAMGIASGDQWKKQPAVMLRKRAKSALAREAYEDVLGGCYVEDEIRDDPVGVAAVEARLGIGGAGV